MKLRDAIIETALEWSGVIAQLLLFVVGAVVALTIILWLFYNAPVLAGLIIAGTIFILQVLRKLTPND